MTQRLPREANSRSGGQEFFAFFGTLSFTSVFTRARHWTLPWARWIQPKQRNKSSQKVSEFKYLGTRTEEKFMVKLGGQ